MSQTQFEAWLAVQRGSSIGLRAARKQESRWAIRCLHNAKQGFDDRSLIEMWAAKTPQQAHALLSKPDVTVTNQSDKTTQLIKVAALDSLVCDAYDVEQCRLVWQAEGLSVDNLERRGFSRAVVCEVLSPLDYVQTGVDKTLLEKLNLTSAEAALSQAVLNGERKSISDAEAVQICRLITASTALTEVPALWSNLPSNFSA